MSTVYFFVFMIEKEKMTVNNSSAGTDERQPQQKLVNGIIAENATKINEYFMNIFQ